MSLLILPLELLLQITSYLRPRDICALILVNRHLAPLLTPDLSRFATRKRCYPCTLHPCALDGIHGPGVNYCALYWAVWKGYERLLQILLEKGFKLNCTSHSELGLTLLHYGAWGGNEGIVRFLLDKGFDVNARDNARVWSNGATPLHFAVLRGHEGVARLLVSRGADINARDKRGFPVLFYSRPLKLGGCQWDPRIFQFLLKNAAGIDSQLSSDGETVLHKAIRMRNLKMIEILLDMGASTAVQSYRGETALELAVHQPNCEVIKLLQIKGVIHLLQGKYYDERQPRGRMEYWRVACGKGLANDLRALGKAFWATTPSTRKYHKKAKARASKMRKKERKKL